MSSCIAIANQKGGVGKTTLSVNLAHNLAVAGNRVLLIDVDPQGNATTSLGVPKPSSGGTWRLLTTGNWYGEEVVALEPEGFFLLPASANLRELEASLHESPEQRRRLATALLEQRSNWDWILVDCPPSLGVLTANAFALADEILIPVQPEFLAMEGLAQMVEAQRLIRREINRELEIGGVVLNMVDPEQDLARDVERELREFFQERVYDSVVRRDVVLAEAPSHGKAVLSWSPRSVGSLGMTEVTKEFIRRHREKKEN